MDIRFRLSLVACALCLGISLASCGGDDSPTDGSVDTTPPKVSSVTPVDAYHIDVTFGEAVTRNSAEDWTHYTIVETAPTPIAGEQLAAPGDPILVGGVGLKEDKKTVTVSTQTSMAGLNLNLTVHGVADASGNAIGAAGSGKSFTGSSTSDNTAPVVLSHDPATDELNVPVNMQLRVVFSEGVDVGRDWVVLGGSSVSFQTTWEGLTMVCTPLEPLQYGTTYVFGFSGSDYSNNAVSATWNFTTENDNYPPTFVSSAPANAATNVDVNTALVLTFSEAMKFVSFEGVGFYPPLPIGSATMSNGNKTITMVPNAPLLADTQYKIYFGPGLPQDLAGNGIAGSHTIVFSTGAQLEAGRIAGTVTGDAGTQAADPTGAVVFAADDTGFNGGGFNVLGVATVAGNNTYTIPNLPDGSYYVVAVMDTDHDGEANLYRGDAIGGFGADPAHDDFDPTLVNVASGAHVTGKNFTMFDPSFLEGVVTYSGVVSGDYPVYVGIYDTDGFTPSSAPVVTVNANGSVGSVVSFQINTTAFPLLVQDGDYYLGAFVDLNGDLTMQSTEPQGFYGGVDHPTAVDMKNGTDTIGISFAMHDFGDALVASTPVAWPKPRHNAAFDRLARMVRQAHEQAGR